MADQAHAVSDTDLDATRRLLAATPGLAGEPSDAERSRTLVATATHATLATSTSPSSSEQAPDRRRSIRAGFSRPER